MRKNKFLKYKLKSTRQSRNTITSRSSKIVLPTIFFFLDNEEKLPKHSKPQNYIVGTGKSRTLELSHTQVLGHSRDLNLGHQCREHTYLPVEATPGNTLPTHWFKVFHLLVIQNKKQNSLTFRNSCTRGLQAEKS